MVEMKKVAYVFPGQGAQAVGMGRDLYDNFAAAKAVFEEADKALGFSLSRLCFEGPEPELRQTINTQPAILTASIAALRAAQAVAGAKLPAPAFVAGHSLGEYTALVPAGVLDFAAAVRLARERGQRGRAGSPAGADDRAGATADHDARGAVAACGCGKRVGRCALAAAASAQVPATLSPRLAQLSARRDTTALVWVLARPRADLAGLAARIAAAGGVHSIPLGEAESRGLVERFDPRPTYLGALREFVDTQAIREAGFEILDPSSFHL